LGGQASHRGPERARTFGRHQLIDRRRRVRGELVELVVPGESTVVTQVVEREVHGDLVQPGSKLAGAAQLAHTPQCLDEGPLAEAGSLAGVTDVPQHEKVDRALIPPDELIEGGALTAAKSIDQRRVVIARLAALVGPSGTLLHGGECSLERHPRYD